ncbi:MAG: NAD(P)/FAD-dependent oxidoreductase [Muribaculaceae bacterium]|nr:NAD(P)/FAD-dependent oxidoreductase [Muribaculaceae bacterium]
MDTRENVLIIGGGFAGLNLAKRLSRTKYNVMVVDRNNFHGFPPLFYQIASSGLDASSISFPLRREFRRMGKHVTYHMGHVKNIDIKAKTVTTSYETIPYDKLVIAAGTTNNYFGMEGLDQTVFGIKTVAEATYTRDEILDRLERGAICSDPVRRRKLLSFLVVGGGPSGVEIAGALGEMKKDILPREYPELNPDDLRIVLVEGSDKLLGSMDPRAGQQALDDLRHLMVEVRLGCVMKGYKDKIVTFADGTEEYWETLIWTAGVRGETMPGLPPEYVSRAGRIPIDPYCRVKGLDDVYAIGDIALLECEDYPKGHPQVAQVAIQMARNLALTLNGTKQPVPFRYNDKGSMATIGKNRAVVDMKGRFISGRIAWLAWMFIHLISILGMRNKLSVLLNWCWNYVTYSTSLRLLFRPAKYPLRKHWGD